MDLKQFNQKDLNTIIECAKLYKEKLENKDFLVIYKKDNKYESIELRFRSQNFMHLTGVYYKTQDLRNEEYSTEEEQEIAYAKHFYKLATSHKLDIKYCYYKADGTTPLKLDVLKPLMSICYSVQMIGDYNHSRPKLYTSKFCGGTSACMGFLNTNQSYFPNTSLKQDIRSMVEKAYPVMIAYIKDKEETHYEKVTKQSKKYEESKMPTKIKELVV